MADTRHGGVKRAFSIENALLFDTVIKSQRQPSPPVTGGLLWALLLQ